MSDSGIYSIIDNNGFNFIFPGNTNKISGVATALSPGLGVPVVIGAATFRNKTTALVTTTVVNTPAATSATYRVVASVFCDTAVATATATLTVSYTDSSSTVINTTGTGALCTTLGTASQQIINLPGLRIKNATNITWAIAIANAPNFDASITVEEMTVN